MTDQARSRRARINLAAPAVAIERLPSGAMIMRSARPLDPHERCIGDMLVHWAERAPSRPFLAERDGESWRTMTFAEVAAATRSIAQSILDRRLSADRPVVVLTDNAIDHALLMLGAMHVGVPVCPISPAYSMISRDYGKLRYILELLRPGLIYAADGEKCARALAATNSFGAELVVSANSHRDRPATMFHDLLARSPQPAVDAAFNAVGPDTIAKILFTSGSTGEPKGVINTQRMLCSNQQAIAQVWPFLAEKPPVIVDWLPWNHTFGGNHNFNMILRHGGSLYIDDGRPTPGLIEKSVANLRQISPTLHFNVPRGFDLLLPYLESDAALRTSFFARLDLVFYAGAALPQTLWERLESVAIAARGERVMMASAWGSTETAPMVTTVHFPIDRAGVIGVPAPGCELKLVPNSGKLELRVRGPNVTPGYWKRDDLTRAAFDADGFYMIGDAGKLVDPDDPSKGIEFDGRIAEDFKLMSGTWVHVGAIRVAAIAALAPVAQDVVVTGHGRAEIGLLVFLNPAGCRKLSRTAASDTPLTELIRCPEVRAAVAAGLERLAAAGGGAASRPTRALLMAEPPSIDDGEITDKGYINQLSVLARRAELVERLHAEPTDPDVVRL